MASPTAPRLVALVFLFAVSAALRADPEPLPVGSGAELGPDEGHLVIAFDSLNRIRNARFAASGGGATSFTHDLIEPGITTFAYRLPAGTYCMTNFHTGPLRYTRKDRSKLATGFCFTLRAGELTYAGHWAPRAGVKHNEGVMHIDLRPRELLARLRADFPALLAAYSEFSDGRASDSAARANLGGLFAQAAFEIGESELGQRLLERAVANGSRPALLELAYRFLEGDGLPQDRRRAMKLYQQSADAGDKLGARSMCIGYLEGWAPDPDGRAARAACERGVDLEDGESAYILAQMHRDKRSGLQPDAAREVELLRLGDAQGHGASSADLGLRLRDGDGVPTDLDAARAAFERAGKEPRALLALGSMHERGLGAEQDAARAAELYRQALGPRAPEAAIAYARLLREGRGVGRDLAEARATLERFARNTPENALAFAWFLATCEDASLRDGSLAERQAWMAVNALPGPDPDAQAVLAAAHAEAGNFHAARLVMTRVLGPLSRRIAPDDPRRARWQAQAANYAAGKPWRE